MESKIIKIKGKFTLEGDIARLNSFTKDFEEAVLELTYNPVVRIVKMKGCKP